MARRRRRIVTGLALGVVLIAGGLAAAWAGGFLLHDMARPASIEDALRRFRVGDPSPHRLDGVYLYSTLGEESLDALGGAHHPYPATTSITAETVPCGLRLRWEALKERSTTWTLCRTRLGAELRASDEVHRFFGQTDRTSYACEGSLLRPVRATAATSHAFRCRSQHGSEAGIVRILGLERARVGSGPVSTLHVRTIARVTGGDAGTETVDWWLDDRAIPIRMVMTSRTSRPLLFGHVHYREDAGLRLTSLRPLR